MSQSTLGHAEFQPKNRPEKYSDLFSLIDTGQMKIPQFQREFVWGKDQTARLIDSLIKGFPIGTFILWRTKDELRYVRNIGNVELPDTPEGESTYFVLDGQQRITSLYAVRKGVRITRDGKEVDYRDISIDLSLDPNSDEPVVFTEAPEDKPTISVYKLLNGKLTELMRDYSLEEAEVIEVYQDRLKGYDFSTIVIDQYPIDIACEVFTRINTGGTELTLFEIMVAKTFDQPTGFDLARKYDYLIDNNGSGKDLEDASYDTIPASTVLQCVAIHLGKMVRRKDILRLDKQEFIAAWPTVVDGIFHAVDYFRSHFRIPVSLMLPYNALLVPFTYFFLRNDGKPPTAIQQKLLTQYFWWASLSSRYASGQDNKLAQDRERMDKILAEEQPSYRGEEFKLTMEDIKWRSFSTGDAVCKAIICLYAYHMPLSFATGSLVRLDNSWLQRANSKNYHHFFPKAYLRRQGREQWEANCVLNITLVDDYLNKRQIGGRAPSDYMRSFLHDNPKLSQTMNSHLIDDLDEFGIWDDDYDRFIEQRAKKVLAELNSRLEPDGLQLWEPDLTMTVKAEVGRET